MSDVLFLLGIIALAAAGFLVSIIAGLVIVGVALLVLSFALSDGTGLPWRRS